MMFTNTGLCSELLSTLLWGQEAGVFRAPPPAPTPPHVAQYFRPLHSTLLPSPPPGSEQSWRSFQIPWPSPHCTQLEQRPRESTGIPEAAGLGPCSPFSPVLDLLGHAMLLSLSSPALALVHTRFPSWRSGPGPGALRPLPRQGYISTPPTLLRTAWVPSQVK